MRGRISRKTATMATSTTRPGDDLMRAFGHGLALCLVAAVVSAPSVMAQSAMPKSIRIVVPFSPGGSNDVIARAIAGPLAKRLDVPVIVENKAGAAGVIGADFVAKGAPRRFRAASDVVELPHRRSHPDTDAVRPGCRVCAGGDDRTWPDAPRRLGRDAFQDTRGCRCGGARKARRAQLRHRRCRLDRPPHDRAPRRYGEDSDDARALQGGVERRGRSRGRTDST